MDNGEGKTGEEKFTTHKETVILEKKYLGKFPIMLGSNLCILKGLSKETKFNLTTSKKFTSSYITKKSTALISCQYLIYGKK